MDIQFIAMDENLVEKVVVQNLVEDLVLLMCISRQVERNATKQVANSS